jgi:endonuclease I
LKEGGHMKKKLTTILTIIIFIIAAFIFVDNQLELGIISSIERRFDTQGPDINTDQLSSAYLKDRDIVLNVSCEDNVDETCEVIVEGNLVNDTIGSYTVVLIARDQQGNETSYEYTYAIVDHAVGNIPVGYYDGLDGLEGDALKTALHNLIKDHTEYPYTHDSQTDVWDILREADEDPNNENNIIGFYTGLSIPKDCQDTTYPPDFCEMEAYGESKIVEWNREHIWSKSRGDFSDDDMTAHNDAHHLVAAERVMNSTKNNRFFEDCHDGDDDNIEDRLYGNFTCNIWEFEPRDDVKGDVARMIFYMAVRYEDVSLDLEVVDDPTEDKDLKLPVYGDLDDLIRWHLEDPVSEAEARRNDIIYAYQGNRNPFIDNPEFVEMIWQLIITTEE